MLSNNNYANLLHLLFIPCHKCNFIYPSPKYVPFGDRKNRQYFNRRSTLQSLPYDNVSAVFQNTRNFSVSINYFLSKLGYSLFSIKVILSTVSDSSCASSFVSSNNTNSTFFPKSFIIFTTPAKSASLEISIAIS